MLITLIMFGVTAFVISLVGIFLYIKLGGFGVWREDPNKTHTRKVLTGAGISLLLTVVIVYLIASAVFIKYLWVFVGIVVTTLLATSLGFVDEIKDIKIWKKVPLMLIPPIPLVVLSLIRPLWGHTDVVSIEFGVLYWILVVPVVYAGFSNGANIIAGYDGLEGGIYILILLLYIFIGSTLHNTLVLLLSIPLLFSILAFEIYNLPPSRVLLGNVGSFPIGGLLGIIPLIGHFEIVLPIVFLPHLIEFLFKIKYRGHTSVFGIVDKDGILHNREKIKSILHWLISWGNMTEKKITMAMLGIEAILCVAAFIGWYIWYAFAG